MKAYFKQREDLRFTGILFVIVLLCLPEILTRPLFGDDSFYLWSAAQIARGIYPIRDFFCIDTVGILAYFSALHALGLHSSVSHWAMLAANVLVTSCLLGIVTRQITGTTSSGVWSAFFYFVFQFRCTPAFAVMGKDMVAFVFIVGGLLLAGRGRWWMLGNLIVGVGLAIKPTLGAIWLVWMAGQSVLHRETFGKWFLKAAISGILIGLPFLAATLWAEQHGWGWAALRANAGLAKGYGGYWNGTSIYKLLHVFAPILWMMPLSLLAVRSSPPFNLQKHLLLLSLFLGGLINWAIQPMFNTWYFVPFIACFVVLAGIGTDTLFSNSQGRMVALLGAGLFIAWIPSTNLRWLKLLGDIHARAPYTLVEHQSRIMSQYAVGNTPPHIQSWIQTEVAALVRPEKGKVGVLVDDGDLLWALKDYPPGIWADWCPSWSPKRVAEGIASGSADVLVGVEKNGENASDIYYEQTAHLRWDMPVEAISALHKNYEPVARRFGYVIYRRRAVEM